VNGENGYFECGRFQSFANVVHGFLAGCTLRNGEQKRAETGLRREKAGLGRF
jgi:hypothetical protein